MDRVNAQQARRILDRIVGWEISPILWRKVPGAKSAGRVQSVAVRLVVDREREIAAFVPAEYWKIGGIFTTKVEADNCSRLAAKWVDFLTNTGNGDRTKIEREKWLAEHDAFVAELVEFAGKKFEASNKDQARAVAEALGFVVDKADTTEDADAKGPARHLTVYRGHLGTVPAVHDPLGGEEADHEPAARAVHHQHAPAVGLQPAQLRGAAGDEDRPDAVRGRPHHLHAYGLDQPVGRGAEHGPGVHRRHVRRQVPAGEAQLLQLLQQERPGGPRGDPPDGRDT